jgi:predicted nucleic acid-binding protein
MASKQKVFWDSCVIIDYLQQDRNKIDILREYTTKGENGVLEIIVSSFAMVEVAKLPELGLPDAEVEEAIEKFFGNPYIVRRAVDARVAKKAREIMRLARVKGKDAVHIATAALAGVSVAHSYDPHLLNVDGLVRDKYGAFLKIEEPKSMLPAMPLFDLQEEQDE